MATNEKFLTFEVSQQAYGLSTTRVREVVPHAVVSPVPDVPPFLLGVTNLRHEVIPVVDLQRLFGDEEPTNIDSRTCFIIATMKLGDGEMKPICLVAHRIQSTYPLSADQIDPPPTVSGRDQVQYMHGLGKTDDGVKVLIDVDRLLAPHDKAINAAINAARRSSMDESADSDVQDHRSPASPEVAPAAIAPEPAAKSEPTVTESAA